MAKRVLLTGAGGFIGAHCVNYFLEKTDWNLVCVDSFRHKGTPQRLLNIVGEDVLDNPRVEIHKHDLSVPVNSQLENLLLSRRIDDRGNLLEKKIDYIINMASESAVERSTVDPVSCAKNNYDLALNMLEFARVIKPEIFFQVSTDEVFGEAKPGQSHKEWDSLIPSNPYAASKAAQEMLAIAYWRTYGVPVVLTSTMNNIGEGQDPEKFMPKIVKMVLQGKEMPIYGDSVDNIGTRFYLHARNHADAFVFLSRFKPAAYSEGADRPDKYNVCGDVEINNLELAQLVAKVIGRDLKWRLVPSDSARPGYDRRYALDGSKMAEKGWVMPLTFEQSIEQIVRWYLDHPESL